MNSLQLVTQYGHRLLTISALVAEKVYKEYKKVSIHIEKLKCSVSFRKPNLAPSTNASVQKKDLPIRIISNNGVTFFITPFIDNQDAKFTGDHINEFNKMENAFKLSALKTKIKATDKPVFECSTPIIDERTFHDQHVVSLNRVQRVLHLS